MSNEIKTLELAYVEASIALSAFRIKNGFEPGVKVLVTYRDHSPKKGVIAPYGEHWGRGAMYVPVLIMDEGYIQPWCMSDLTIIEKE